MKRDLLLDLVQQRGDRLVKTGDQYFLSCRCGEIRITSSAGAVSRFLVRHEPHRPLTGTEDLDAAG